MPGMQSPGEPEQLATLWNLHWNGDWVRCVVYRTERGMELTVESAEAVMHREQFDMQPRALARARALRAAMIRRGWADVEPS